MMVVERVHTTDVIGRPVRQISLDPAALAARFVAQGLPHDYAKTLTGLGAKISAGAKDCMTLGVERMTGQRPTSFRDLAHRVFEQLSRTDPCKVDVPDRPSGVITL